MFLFEEKWKEQLQQQAESPQMDGDRGLTSPTHHYTLVIVLVA